MRRIVWILVPLLAACDDKPAAPPSDAALAAPSVASVVTPPSSSVVATAPSAPPMQIAAQHILVAYREAARAPVGVTRSRADAKARAAEVDAKAKAGDDFTELVNAYSDDPEAKARLGSLGKFSRDKMEKAFSDAAFALAVGQISDVVETRFGFHVIKRNQ
jgi:NIMA-interacting peptidyl-prolyl cis-trans isomerase 1